MTERQDIRRLQQELRRVKGASGADGTDGIDGVDGATGPTGPAGVDGADGATGPTGPAGVDGADGEGVALGGTANQALTKIDSTDFNTQWSTVDNSFVGSEPADATILKDADIGNSVQAWDADLDILAANGLTAAELGELQNINTVTITNAQWAFLGAFDQGLATTDSAVFNRVTITATSNPHLILLQDVTGIAFSTQFIGFSSAIALSDTDIERTFHRTDYYSLDATNAAEDGRVIHNVIKNGVLTQYQRVDSDLSVRWAGESIFAGNMAVNSTTDSTAPTTGSIRTDGGLGVVKNLHVGGEVFLNLPTSTGTAGSLWNDAGTVKVS